MRSSYILAAAVTAALAAASAQTASAALVLQYDSPQNIPAGGVAVSGTIPAIVGPNGTAYGTITHSTIQNGTDGPDAYGITGTGSNLAGGWNTGVPFSSLTANGTTDESFTAFAIVTPTGSVGTLNGPDAMIFGTNGGNPLHLGIRSNFIQYGMWGNDSSGGTAPVAGQTVVLAWRFEPDANGDGNYTQSIFINGSDVSDSPAHGGFGSAGDDLTIGTTNGNGGTFSGGIDDIRWYNDAESNANVAAITADMLAPDVPEPATLGLTGIGLIGLLARRRGVNA